MTFSDVVEAIKRLSTDEKQEIQLLLKQYLREERRAGLARLKAFCQADLFDKQ